MQKYDLLMKIRNLRCRITRLKEQCSNVVIDVNGQDFANVPPGTYIPATIVDENGDEVTIQSINGTIITIAGTTECPEVCVSLTIDEEIVFQDCYESGEDIVLPIDAFVPVCSPATYTITIGETEVDSGSIPCGTEEEIDITPYIPACPNPPNTGIYKSGQTILVLPSDAVRNSEGMGADWWNLDPATQNANIFGNYKRFTSAAGNYQNETNGLFYDKDGNVLANYAAAFPMGMIVDWSTRDWQYGKVLAYALNNVVAGIGDTRANLNTQFEALTIGPYANWKLPNLKELFNICHVGLANRTNYIPFNNSANLATNFWVRDSHDALTGSRINLGAGSNFVQTTVALNTNNRGLAVSYLTISGTTLI